MSDDRHRISVLEINLSRLESVVADLRSDNERLRAVLEAARAWNASWLSQRLWTLEERNLHTAIRAYDEVSHE